MSAGQQLRTLREQRGITVRHVQEASRRIADAAGDARYQISNGWLVHLENCASLPNMYHLFVLSATYRVHFSELLRVYGINLEEQARYEALANPHVTQIFFAGVTHLDFTAPESTTLDLNLREKLPMKITFDPANDDSRLIYAQLGAHELTMHPLIRPGSILAIDTTRNRIECGPWTNKFERPIYLLELREGFTCGWCERNDSKLRILSYGSSVVKEFIYPQDAEVIGRVIAYYTPCVDFESKEAAKSV